MIKTKERSCPDVQIETAPSQVTCRGALYDCVDYTVVFELLQEETKGNFHDRKVLSLVLADIYSALSFSGRASRVSDCGSFLEFYVTHGGRKRLKRANFCKDRLCPMCNWRRSLKIFSQVSSVMDVLENSGFQFIFATFTIRNCSAEDLPSAISQLMDGWRYMYHKHKRVMKVVKGAFRSLEVTRNAKTGCFHPHLHIIFAVNSSYFTSRQFISQREWSLIWKECCGLDYVPVVDVRRITDKGGKGLSGAVAEVAKYAVKSVDYLTGDVPQMAGTVLTYLRSLSNRRLCSFVGCFQKVRKALNLDDVETGDLVFVDGDQLRDDVAALVVRYGWRVGCYQVIDVERMGDDVG